MFKTCVLLALLLALAGPACAQPPEAGSKASRPALIVTAPVEQGQPSIPRTLVGTAEPRYTASVASEADGLVQHLASRRGDRVARGEVIARLRTYRVELLLEEARARLQEVEARSRKAEADLKRARELHAQRIISEEELQARQTDLDTLAQEARRHQATIRILEDRLNRMTVRAPFSGRVVKESTEVGQWVDEGDAIVELADLSIIQVMAPVPEQYLGRISLGMPARVAFDAVDGESFTGEVTAIVPQADLAARTFPVQISVANPQERILAGMLARVTFSRDLEQPGLLVPKDAFVPRPDGGGHVVKIVEQAAAIVPVQILQAAGDDFAVQPLAGTLTAGDRVVVRGNERLRDGQPVQEAAAGGKPAP